MGSPTHPNAGGSAFPLSLHTPLTFLTLVLGTYHTLSFDRVLSAHVFASLSGESGETTNTGHPWKSALSPSICQALPSRVPAHCPNTDLPTTHLKHTL